MSRRKKTRRPIYQPLIDPNAQVMYKPRTRNVLAKSAVCVGKTIDLLYCRSIDSYLATGLYLIYDRLPILINSYVRNSVDKTALDRVSFLRELIMIRDSSFTLSGFVSSDELNSVMSHVCTS